MRTTPLALAASVILFLTGAAQAQAPAGGGGAATTSTPGGVTGNDGTADARRTGSSANDTANPGGRSSDHNGTARTLGKGTRPDGSPATPAPRP